MESLPADLLKEIECPVCLELMVPPITQCINGHNICNDCKPMVNKCPTCMCEFSTVRNRTAEKLSSKVKRPCKYSSSGCEEKLSLDELAEHERACCFGHYLCPFHIAGSCNWEGFFGAIKQHVQMSHSENMKTIQNENHLVCLRNYKYVDKSREACIVMLRNDIFFRYSLFLNDYMHICIMFVGPLNPAIDYMYNVTLKTADGMESVSAYLKCPNYTKFIFEEFPDGRCVASFHRSFVDACINKNLQLKYECEITL